MVSQEYIDMFSRSILLEQGAAAAGPPHVIQIGQDARTNLSKHMGKLASEESLLVRTYWRDATLPTLDMQVPIQPAIAEHAIIFSAACAINAPVPFSIMVAPASTKFFSWNKPTFIQLGTTSEEKWITASKVIKKRIGWDPFLDILNGTPELVEAWDHPTITLSMEESYGMTKSTRPIDWFHGYGRLIAFKGWTIIETILAPSHSGLGINSREHFNLPDIHHVFSVTAKVLYVKGIKGKEIGDNAIHKHNEALYERFVTEIMNNINNKNPSQN
jgi:hypothetical protein